MKEKIYPLLICLILVSCMGKPQGENSPGIVEMGTPISRETSNPTQLSTFEATLTPTQSFTVTISPTSTSEFVVIHETSEVENDLSNVNLSGRIVIISDDWPDFSYIWDLDENTKTTFHSNSQEDIYDCVISPDRKSIALRLSGSPNNKKILRIIDYKGKQILEEFFTYQNRAYLIEWYDNDHLVFEQIRIENNNLVFPWDLVIYNPFTQEKLKELSITSYPGSAKWRPPRFDWGEYSNSLAVYSPDYGYVVYYQDDLKITLRDIKEEKIIVTLDPGWDTGPPRWVSDGQSFLIDMYTDHEAYLKDFYLEEMFRVNLAGEMERLTYLTEVFPEVNIESYQASPSGEKIAFWIKTNSTNPIFYLAVMETETKQIRIFESVIYYAVGTFGPGLPIWSPDSSQIMIATRSDDEEICANILDVQDNSVLQLGCGFSFAGWLCDDTP